MDHRYPIGVFPLFALTAIFVATAAQAQQAAEPSVPPATQGPDAPAPEDPAVQAILATNPSAPWELVRAAKILADLGRPDLGKQYLKRVIATKLSQQQMADLAERFGSPMFVEMATRSAMLPEARQLSEAVLAAANARFQDPQRLAGLISQLQDPSAETRYHALAELQKARGAAVGALIGVLADPARAPEYANVQAALVRMGSDAHGPLLGILEKADAELAARAIRVLAAMEAKRAAVYLLAPYGAEESAPAVRAAAGMALGRLVGHVPTRREAIRLLTERADAVFNRGTPPGEVNGPVEVWSWDEAKRQCISKSCSAEDAALVTAARLARDAYALAKDDAQIRLLYLATMLERAAYENGLDQPPQDGQGAAEAEARGFGVAVMEDLLQYAIADDHAAAATAAARVLGEIGTARGLLYQGSRPAPLVRATRHPDRRLRMAATEAVVRLQPTQPFPGSSYIPESLAFFAATGGRRRALVAGPSTETSRRLAGALSGLGFEVDTAVSGRRALRLAWACPDYELALIAAAIDHPPADLLLQQLRRDCRSRTLRVGLIARAGFLEQAERIARRNPMTLAFPRPHTDDAIRWQVERLATLAPRRFVPHRQRQHQAARALDRLAELGGSGTKLFNLYRIQGSVLAASHVPELANKAVAVLEHLGTPESQRALTELASRWTQPLEGRQAAVKAFRRNTQQYGILLTSDEILRQYDRYNRSEDLDANTQHVLGLILDCIEAPTQPLKPADETQPEGERGMGNSGEES